MSYSVLALAIVFMEAVSTAFGQESGTNDAMRRAMTIAPGIPAPSGHTYYTRVPLPRGTITGTVTDTNGRKVYGAMIRFIGAYIKDEFVSKKNGEFTIPDVGAHKYDIEISSPYYYTHIVRGCIVAGDSTTVLKIRLTRKSRGHMGDILHRTPPLGEKMGMIRSTAFDTWGRPCPYTSSKILPAE